MRKKRKDLDNGLNFAEIEDYTKEALGDMKFDLEGSHDQSEHPEVTMYKNMLAETTSKLVKYEKFLMDRNLLEEADESFISDEEIICLQGIEAIKQLVIGRVFTKDDINAFDVLHRNLCMIRGIKIDKNSRKKETPRSREELLKLVSKK